MSDYVTGDVIAMPSLRSALNKATVSEEAALCFTVPATADDDEFVYLFPITSARPKRGGVAVEVPQIEARRAGLNNRVGHWIMLSEMLLDVSPSDGRVTLHRAVLPPKGRFSGAFVKIVLAEFHKYSMNERRQYWPGLSPSSLK